VSRGTHRKQRTGLSPRMQRVPLEILHAPTGSGHENLKRAVVWRMGLNLAHTGDPFHHQAADGTIVDQDPTLEEWMAHIPWNELPPIPTALPGALPAVPVVRDWYQREPGRTWLRQWIAWSRGRGA
jgi:hypothetical protein